MKINSENVQELSRKNKIYNTLGKFLGGCAVIVGVSSICLLAIDDYTTLGLYLFGGSGCVYLLCLIIVNITAKRMERLLIFQFEEFDFIPEYIFLVDSLNDTKFYINYTTKNFTYSKHSEVGEIYSFDDLLDFYETKNSEMRDGKDYCVQLSLNVNLKNHLDSFSLDFIKNPIAKSSNAYMRILKDKDAVYNALKQIQSSDKKTADVSNEISSINDNEIDALKKQVEKEQLKATLNSIKEKKCKYCGLNNYGDVKNCRGCGASLDN